MIWLRIAALTVAGLTVLAPLIATIVVLVWAPSMTIPESATGAAILLSVTSATFAGIAAGIFGYAVHLVAANLSHNRMIAISLALAVPLLVPLVGTGLVGAQVLAEINATGGASWVILSHVLLGLPIGVFVIQRVATPKTRIVLDYVQTLAGPAYRRHLYGFLPLCMPIIGAAIAIAALVALEDATLAWYVGGTTYTYPILIANAFRGVIGTEVVAGGAILFGIEAVLLYIIFRNQLRK